MALKTTALFAVSDLATAEFSAVVSTAVRSGTLTEDDARLIFEAFDQWVGRRAFLAPVEEGDIDKATAIIRALNTKLRAPDAIHVVVAERKRAELATFDKKMVEAADVLGVPLAAF